MYYDENDDDDIDHSGHITHKQFLELKRANKTRICSDLVSYEKHVCAFSKSKSAARCVVCGLNSYRRCGICNKAMHCNDTKGAGKGLNCAIQWHSDAYLGLCFDDRKILNVAANEWTMWSKKKLANNKRIVQGYKVKGL